MTTQQIVKKHNQEHKRRLIEQLQDHRWTSELVKIIIVVAIVLWLLFSP